MLDNTPLDITTAFPGICVQPQPVPAPTQLTASMRGLRSDEELAAFIADSKGGGTAVVEFGTTWCLKCHEMFPQFHQLSKKVGPCSSAAAGLNAAARAVQGFFALFELLLRWQVPGKGVMTAVRRGSS